MANNALSEAYTQWKKNKTIDKDVLAEAQKMVKSMGGVDALKKQYADWRTEKTLGFKPNNDVIKSVSDKWKSGWEYNILDPEDWQRKAQGIMPKATEKKYNLRDATDRYLYENNLPNKNKFSEEYRDAEKAWQEEQNKQTLYNQQMAAFKDELYPQWVKGQRDVYAEAGSGEDVKYDPQSLISQLLSQDKYGELAQHFQAPVNDDGEYTYSDISAAVRARKQEEKAKEDPYAFTVSDLEKFVQDNVKENVKEKLTAATDYLKQQATAETAAREVEKAAPHKSIQEVEATLKQIGEQINALKAKRDAEIEKTPAILRTGALGAGGIASDAVEEADKQIRLLEKQRGRIERELFKAKRSQELKKYDKFLQDPNFETLAKAGASKNMDVVLFSHDYPRHRYINDIDDARTKGAASTSEQDAYFKYSLMTEQEIKLYNYLFAKEGQKAAINYLDALDFSLNERAANANKERLEQKSEEMPVLSSAASVLYTPAKAAGYGYSLVQGISGNEIDPNSPWFDATRGQSTIRETVSQDFSGIGKFLYNTGMSIADFLAMAPMGQASLAFMGMGAASDTTLDALERGASQSEAIMLGTLAGAAEVVFEKVSLDKLVKMAAPGARAAFIKNVLLQSGVEATEEMFTELANTISDNIVMGDLSNYQQAVQAYMQSGMTREEAENKASGEIFGQILVAGLGGALSGGVTSSFAQGIGDIRTARVGKKMGGMDAANELQQTGLSMPQDTLAYEIASRDGKQTNLRVGQQYLANIEAQQAQQRAAFEQDVSSLGMAQNQAQAVMRAYDSLNNGNIPTAKRAMAKLQGSVMDALSVQAETQADLSITKAEVTARLAPMYTAMQQAIEAGDTRAFQQAAAKYNAQYAVEQAKGEAAKLKAQTQMEKANRAVESVAAGIEEEAAALAMNNQQGIFGQNNVTQAPLNGRINQGGMQDGGQGTVYTGLPRRNLSADGQGTVSTGQTVSGEASARPGSSGNIGANGEGYAGIHPGNETQVSSQMAAGQSETAAGDRAGSDPGGGSVRIAWGRQSNPETEASIQRHLDTVKRNTGQDANVRLINQVDPKTASMLDWLKTATGKDAFLYESDDEYGNGWADSSGVYLRMNGTAHIAFLYGHEAAHADGAIMAAGLAELEKLGPFEKNRYAVERSRRLSSQDDADISHELVADVYGKFLYETTFARQSNDTFGMSQEAIYRMYGAFEEALGAQETEDGVVDITRKPVGGEAEYARITLVDGKQFVKADRQVISGNNPDRWKIQVSNWFDTIVNQNGYFELPTLDREIIRITTPATGEQRTTSWKMSDYGDQLDDNGNLDQETYGVKTRATVHLDELIQTARTKDLLVKPDRRFKHDALASKGWKYAQVYFMDFDGKYYEMKISIGIGLNGNTAYNINDIRQRKSPVITGSSLSGAPVNGGLLGTSIRNPQVKINNQNQEYSRNTFQDEYGNDISYSMPEIREREQKAPAVKEFKLINREEEHIDLRSRDSVGSRKVTAFSFAHPELRPYIVEMAQNFLYDLENGTKGERFQIQGQQRWGGVKRFQTEAISQLLDSKMTYAEIRDGLNRLIQGEGQENTAAAKKVELALDDALSNGYTGIDGDMLPPNVEYLLEKSRIQGAQPNILFNAEQMQELQEAIQADTISAALGEDLYYADFTVDGKRMRITGKSQEEVLEKAAQIKQDQKARYYADFTLNGERMRLEGNDKAALEAQIKELKQQHAMENLPQPVKNYREANRLFNEGVDPGAYYESGEYDHRVARLLRGLYIRNGKAIGGALPEQQVLENIQNINQWKNQHDLARSFTTPQRVFQEMGNWRNPNTPSARALNYLEGKHLEDTYWHYVVEQGAEANRWMREQRDKIASVYKEGDVRTSTLAQMLGEGMISERAAKDALFDGKSMVVQDNHGTFVFDKTGQLKAVQSGDQLLLFDESYYKRIKEANKLIREMAQGKDKKMTDGQRFKAIRELEKQAREARPREIEGRLTIQESGNNIKVLLGNTVLADIRNGKHPDMGKVTALKDALSVFYNEVFERQNRTLVDNGYQPIHKRENYFPHQGRTTTGIQDFIETIRGESQKLPAAISGKTGTFEPGKPFTSHLLERLGMYTEFDAIRGFNTYVQSAADLIYYTPAIQRLRQLESAIRENSEGTQNSGLVSWLQNYTNQLANKKSGFDRSFEEIGGRSVYTVSDKLAGWFGAASVAGNLSSAASNMISYLSALPSMDPRYAALGMKETILNGFQSLRVTPGEYDGFADQIPFLVRRFQGYESILTTELSKVKRAGNKALSAAFITIDRLAVEAAARGKYYELMAKGYTQQEAIKATDGFLTQVFADRSKGMSAAVFNIKVLKPFVQFQQEVLNQTSHFRDIDRLGIGERIDKIVRENGGDIAGIDWAAVENQFKGLGGKAAARKFAYLLLMSLWGWLTRELLGRDQTWNPIGMATDFARDWKQGGLGAAATNLGTAALEQLPFSNMITPLITGEDAGRVPFMGGVEKARKAAETLLDEDATGAQKAMDVMQGLTSFIPGGAQLSKTIRGVEAASKGGSYTSSGKLRYPISDEDYFKIILFGPSAAAPEGYDWQKDTLSETRTGAYREMVEEGLEPFAAYDFLRNMQTDSKAAKLGSIATFDGDGDGTPDFDNGEMNLIAEILEVKIPTGKTVREAAKAEIKGRIKKIRADDDLTKEEQEAKIQKENLLELQRLLQGGK